MTELKEGQTKVEIVKLTDKKIVVTEMRKENGLIFCKARIRMLHNTPPCVRGA